jgi:hypothetical protein
MSIGLTFIVCGLNGDLVLKGTDSGGALAVLGALLSGWGVLSIVSMLRAESEESARSRRMLSRGARGPRTPPRWLSTRRRR